MERHLWLVELRWSRHQLSLVYGFDTLRFETAYWYESVDLLEPDPQPILKRLVRVARDDADFPASIAERILPRLEEAADGARRFILDILQGHPTPEPPPC